MLELSVAGKVATAERENIDIFLKDILGVKNFTPLPIGIYPPQRESNELPVK